MIIISVVGEREEGSSPVGLSHHHQLKEQEEEEEEEGGFVLL